MRWMPLLALTLLLSFSSQGFSQDNKRLNFVFIGAEDISPDLGCYGCKEAITPNLDRLASQGARFNRCFTHAPVCAPSRSGMVTGMYPTSFGSHHMRSTVINPPVTFMEELKKAGYYVAWPGKTDFNFKDPKQAFNTTENWMKKNELKEPFFAYINFVVTHESQVRPTPEQYKKNTARLKPEEFHNPAQMTLPPYYPDTQAVRKNIATYHDNITAMDYMVGDVLKYLDDKKLADNTVVVFFGDHGWGLPRGKRWCYDSGLRCPLIVRWPGKIKAGSVRDDLVAFVDFAPTFLKLAGLAIPERMQGQPFLGDAVKERAYVYGARDRMDETFDRIRTVRDQQFRYIRNFYPQLPYSQNLLYMDEMPAMQDWRKAHKDGTLTGPQKIFFEPNKPKEELYDCQADPHEIKNLADDPKHAVKLKELRTALDQWIIDTKDLGEIPESKLIERGIVEDRIGPGKEYDERIKKHPANSKASPYPPKE
jgi:N-sulfoglucosamine sulfohydrolase